MTHQSLDTRGNQVRIDQIPQVVGPLHAQLLGPPVYLLYFLYNENQDGRFVAVVLYGETSQRLIVAPFCSWEIVLNVVLGCCFACFTVFREPDKALR